KTMMLEDLISLNIMKIYYEGDESILPEDYQESADKFIETVESQESAKTYMEKYKITNQALTDFFISQYYSVAFFDELEAGLPGITDEEVKAYFDENQDQFKIDEVTAKHILVEEEELAEEILVKLKDGADFGEMAAQYGTDSTAQNGGDLGTFGRNSMDPDFEKAAFALNPGELSDVVKTQFGYHIIYLTDKKQGMETFENVKDTILAKLENEVLSQAYTDKIKDLREEVGVEYLSE
ncbi:MAG: peptidylprolyl isomerase, partial [Methanosarcina sp.]|nr:peptidylprolyl isomerase [Methanosarcina sp.]